MKRDAGTRGRGDAATRRRGDGGEWERGGVCVLRFFVNMIRAEIVAGAMAFALAGQLDASMLGADPAAALFSTSVTVSEVCRTTPENPVSTRACTFLTSSAMVADLQLYAAAQTGSADLIALLEMTR